MSQFASPAEAGGFNFEEHKGRLLMFDVASLESDVATTFGEKDAIRATVTVLDGEAVGEVAEDVLIFPLVLIQQLRPRVGQKVLGRLSQGVAKPGQKPPWKLEEATAEEIALAEKWVAENATPTVTSAAAPF
jgi:hypothetical protein